MVFWKTAAIALTLMLPAFPAPTLAREIEPLETAQIEVQSELSENPLQQTSWRLQAWDGETPTDELPPMTARFTQEVVRGSAGCNTYFAEYQATGGDRLTVSPPGTTRRACQPEVMAAELDYLVALEAVTHYRLTPDGNLLLSYDADTGSGTLEFVSLQD